MTTETLTQTQPLGRQTQPLGRQTQLLGRSWPTPNLPAARARARALSPTSETLGIYALSRLLVFAVVAGLVVTRAGNLRTILEFWDGSWYTRIADNGYPAFVPSHAGHAVYSTLAFFPLFPTLTRALDTIIPIGATATSVALATTMGAVATLLVRRVTAELFDDDTARRAVLLFSFLPGAFVLSFAYSESTFLVLAMVSLVLLRRQRWVLAGMVGMLATLTRPNAIVLAACAGYAAWEAIRRDRDWSALAAPLLTPLGFIGFNLYLWVHTGEAGAWFRVESQAWHEHFDGGINSISRISSFLWQPWASFDNLVLGIGTVCLVVGLWSLSRARLPVIYNVFAFGIVGQAFASGVIGPRPRFMFTAFPLTIAAATRLRGRAFVVALVASAASLVFVIAFYTINWRTRSFITPP